MRRLSFVLIGLTSTFAFAQSATSTTGTSSMSMMGGSMSGGSMSGASMMNGASMTGGSMSGSSMMGGSMSGGSMNGSSMMGGSMNGSSMMGGSMSGSSMSGGSMTGGMATTADRTFVTAAGQGNNFEIDAAKIAVTNSSNATVKAYAQKMITDHTKLGASVKAALTKDRANLTVPTTVAAGQQATLNKLKGLKGAAFDAAYKNAMVSSHAETYGLFQQYVKSGRLTSLKSAIEQGLPVVKMHWDEAKTLPST